MAGKAVAREVFAALRRDIARIEGTLPERLAPAAEQAILVRRRGRAAESGVPTGAGRLDAALGGGIPAAGLSELRGQTIGDAGAVSGFALAMAARACPPDAPLVWIAISAMFREAGRPYLPGIAAFCGIGEGRLLIAEAERPADVLWIAEQAASLTCVGAVLLELAGHPRALDLTATRRLHRRALGAGRPLFLLRHSARPEATAAPLRLAVSPAAALPRATLSGPLTGSIGPPGFRISIEKSRLSPPAHFLLHWNSRRRRFEEENHEPATKDVVAVAAAAADGPDLPFPLGPVVAQAREPRRTAAGEPARSQYEAHRRA